MRRLLTAWVNAMTAALENFAAETPSEAAKKLPERHYWQGYHDGISDAREESSSERS